MVSLVQSGKWIKKGTEIILAVISWMVFLFLDVLEVFMCIFYRLLDEFLEGKASSSCYCMELMEEKEKTGDRDHVAQAEVDGESELSETLYRRRNFFRGLLGSLGISLVPKGWRNGKSFLQMRNDTKWSDCGCDSCVEWIKNADDPKLHVVVQEPQTGGGNTAFCIFFFRSERQLDFIKDDGTSTLVVTLHSAFEVL